MHKLQVALNLEEPVLEAPYALPPGKVLSDVIAQKPCEGPWREMPDFVCLQCGSHAFLHPNTNLVWGCLTCNISIYVWDPQNAEAILAQMFKRALVGAEMT